MIKNRIFLAGIICLMVISNACNTTQNVIGLSNSNFNGVWAGKMIQPFGPRGQDGYRQYFQIKVKGTTVEGFSRIEIPDTLYFGEMSISGTIKNDSLFFSEDSISKQRARENYWWCLKNGILVLDKENMTLKGEWQSKSNNCSPGRIELHRIF